MCQIRYIKKTPTGVTSDCFVKISGKEYEILDKPYYVVRTDNESSIEFIFHYIDNNECNDDITSENLQLFYGKKTGRIYKFCITNINMHISNILWENFRKDKIEKLSIESEISKNNIIFSYNVIKKLYFDDYQIITQDVL